MRTYYIFLKFESHCPILKSILINFAIIKLIRIFIQFKGVHIPCPQVSFNEMYFRGLSEFRVPEFVSYMDYRLYSFT